LKRPEQALSDEALISAAKAGDRKAFTALVRRYEDTVYRFAYKLCRDREKAEETFQDTFISVFRKLSSFDGKSKFSTWLYTVVTNNCLMRHRKRRIRELEDPLEVLDHPEATEDGRLAHHIAPWPETPADAVLKREMREMLEEAIEKLPEDYRVVFVLRDIEGKSTEETADILGLSVEATKSRLRRGRAFLRNVLEPYMASKGGDA
jgi:RNA polymerase sigma-70 factor, ECF subfamily